MKAISNAALAVTLCLLGSQLSAFGNMSAAELSSLFSGNTVEGEQRQGVAAGTGPQDAVDNYAIPFTAYYDSNGTVKKKIGNKLKTGKWRVADDGKLCIQWKGKKELCEPVHREGKVYVTAVRNKSGRILREFRFIHFHPGNISGL